jgi:hypothetical protein
MNGGLLDRDVPGGTEQRRWIGWYATWLRVRAAYDDPEDLIREAMYYRGSFVQGRLVCGW